MGHPPLYRLPEYISSEDMRDPVKRQIVETQKEREHKLRIALNTPPFDSDDPVWLAVKQAVKDKAAQGDVAPTTLLCVDMDLARVRYILAWSPAIAPVKEAIIEHHREKYPDCEGWQYPPDPIYGENQLSPVEVFSTMAEAAPELCSAEYTAVSKTVVDLGLALRSITDSWPKHTANYYTDISAEYYAYPDRNWNLRPALLATPEGRAFIQETIKTMIAYCAKATSLVSVDVNNLPLDKNNKAVTKPKWLHEIAHHFDMLSVNLSNLLDT